LDNLSAIMNIAGSGMHAQQSRMKVISENIANARSTGDTPGSDPYQRKIISFEEILDRKSGGSTVGVRSVDRDQSAYNLKYDPKHPAADPNTGYVKMPNVNTLIESQDMMEASRSYEANMNMLDTGRKMKTATIDLLK
jgi:flagellar basal-body rod protein FlgC